MSDSAPTLLRGLRWGCLAVSLAAFSLTPSSAWAQSGNDGGECSGGLCGSPDQTGGGGCGCGGASILINNTDRGDTYQYGDDYDADSFEDDFDNCPFVANESQTDADGDGVGDACDLCLDVPDAAQLDADGDGMGDLCDADADDDRVENSVDVCPLVANPSQIDTDLDGLGDACDPDDDNDNVLDGRDNCPLFENPDQVMPADASNCDRDTDQDGIMDSVDNCLVVYNDAQEDLDADGVGDQCDGDLDGDGVANVSDNCRSRANAGNTDTDRDGIGDACDDRLCYVVGPVGQGGDASHCLDPELTFTVLSLPQDAGAVGAPSNLPIFANRKNQPFRYVWTVIRRPNGSTAEIDHPSGSVVSLPTPGQETDEFQSYQYFYQADRASQFVPDVEGEYELQLSAELIFDDELFAGNNTSRTSLILNAGAGTGESGTGCASASRGASGQGTTLVLLSLGALGLVFRRRRRR